MKVAVAGGTGLVGGRVVERLRRRGDDVVVLARSAGVDLVSGEGLAEALAGVEVVLDASSTRARRPVEWVKFFGSVARNLQSVGAAAGVGRIVTLSIVGIDGLGGSRYGHYEGKNAQEAATQAGPVPSVILRATQFHGFPGRLIDRIAKGPVMPCPKQPMQTVEVDAVAEELVELTRADVDGDRVRVDIAGPERRPLADLVRRTARARGQRLVVVPVWRPGEAARRVRAGALQAPPGALIAGSSFQEWLAREYADQG